MKTLIIVAFVVVTLIQGFKTFAVPALNDVAASVQASHAIASNI